MLDVDQKALADSLTGLAVQLERMSEGAAYVADGCVRVRDPVYLIEKLKAAAKALAARRSSSDEQAEVVGWPIDTEDQVEALAKECGWNNRRYMTPKDYTIWCDQMRQFARLASPVAMGGVTEEMAGRAMWLALATRRNKEVYWDEMPAAERQHYVDLARSFTAALPPGKGDGQ